MSRPENDQKSKRILSVVGKKAYAVTLPIDLIKELGWKRGDTLIVRRQSKQLFIEKEQG